MKASILGSEVSDRGGEVLSVFSDMNLVNRLEP